MDTDQKEVFKVMGKATKVCDFDLPETPIERIIRGLKIALAGANAEDDSFEDVRNSIKDDLDFAFYELKCRKFRTKYKDELTPATRNNAIVYFNFDDDIATEIEISGNYTNYVSPISTGKKRRHDIKRAVEQWLKKEAQAHGEKAKKRS